MFNQENAKVARAQKIMLEMLCEAHKICEKHNLRYWLEAGTLLGGVREGGFIPWDDDLDIAMPREDYEKFCLIAPNELPKDMLLQNKETEPYFYLAYGKIRKLGTELIETGETGRENYNHGIFIDIFPYDCYKYKWLLELMQWERKTKDEKNKYPKGTWKHTKATICNNIFRAPGLQVAKYLRRYFGSRHLGLDSDAEYFTFALEDGTPVCTKRDDILPVQYKENFFEGHGFYVPNNEHNVLVANFGENYMTPPPIGERKTHAKSIRFDM